jgi:hypothetical protein
MKENANSKRSKVLRQAAIMVVAIGMAVVPARQAKPNSNKAQDKPANVVAHVQLSSGPVMRMLFG